MPLARRKFVKSSLLFTASTVLFWGSARSVLAQTLRGDGLSIEVQRDPVYRFTRETFEPYVGGYFETPGARGKMIALKLVKVAPYESKAKITPTPAVPTESFSLLFVADGELPIFTTIHPIKHNALGEFSLFLTRQEDGPNGEIRYEAVFNHVR